MKRPFALIGTVCFISSVIMGKFGFFTVSIVGFTALAVFLLSLILVSPASKYSFIIYASFAVAAVSVSTLFIIKNVNSTSVYNEKTVDFSGTVTSCEYYSTYEKLEIKVNSVNGKKENFHITAYSNENTGLSEGDKISANAKFTPVNNDKKTVKSMLADKIYFNANNMSELTVKGENIYYKAVYKIKLAYKTAVQSYLPNELGAVALGMTIGDRSTMSTYLRNCFNYSGTAHLLVVSGLHLTLWTLIISNFIPVLRKRKYLNMAVTSAFIILYLALTGFSVSVVRAGVMLFILKLAKLLNRGSDSLNALGFAISVLLIKNPFSVNSVSLLLSMGSTLGLIVFASKIHDLIYKSKIGKIITKYSFGRLVADSFAVSVSVSVFTLPVFILFFHMFPVFSFVSNIFIIDLSSVLMVLSVLGALMHFSGILPIAKCLFYFSGIITKSIIFIAEKIGMLRYSTVAVSSRYFRFFLMFAVVISAVLLLILRNRKKARLIIVSAVVITGFVFTVFVNENFEAVHPSVDISFSSNSVCALVRDGYDSVFVGAESRNAGYIAGDMLNRHNLKAIGCIYVSNTDAYTFAHIQNITNDYPANSFAFAGEKVPPLKPENCRENIKSITLNNAISINALSEKSVKITCRNEDIFISCDKSMQNLLEFNGKYDIIILSIDAFNLYGEEVEKFLKNAQSQIIVLDSSQIIIYPDAKRIYYSESF